MSSPSSFADETGLNSRNSTPPVFQLSSSFDDELQFQFAPMSSASDQTVATEYTTLAAATEEAQATSPVTQYRDAPHMFANAPVDLLADLDDSSFFSQQKAPVFVLDAKKQSMASSPLSPAACSAAVAVPEKDCWDAVFSAANPSFPSRANPDKIVASLQRALASFDCAVRVERQWTLRVSWLCVAEEIAFSIQLSQQRGDSTYEVDFRREVGDETVFHELVECIRARCSDVDLEPLFFMETTLDPWLDAKQELAGRRYAIRDTEAALLIKELNADLHVDTLYEVAKVVKNHCRHRGNRRMFLEADRDGFLQALKWMLADSEVLARFAVFILQQYAKDTREGADESAELFSSAFERNSFALLLSEVETRESRTACAQYTTCMVEQVQQSWIFA
ncbi:hypothetical protein BBJ28_00020905 [Nothophytophthora sp. Chile5]|nr:hypothetical protein BBJ28_00020905 [Nothophytophthora sp. Chile5]